MPGDSSRPQSPNQGPATTTPTGPTLIELKARADLMLRIAWLTVHAERMYDVDEGGLLSAQLLDLRDVLEVVAVQGWPR